MFRRKKSLIFLIPDYHCSFLYRDELRKRNWKVDIYNQLDFPANLLYDDKDIITLKTIGGESLTAGFEYSSKNKKNENFYSLSLANILRLDENPDLPKIYGIANKRSDIIGNFNFAPSKFFDFNYQFSLDKNLSNSNYNLIKTDININNFITSFEFLEEDNYLSQDSYLSNTTKFIFDKNKSLSFGASKNLNKNITNYYNIIYVFF